MVMHVVTEDTNTDPQFTDLTWELLQYTRNS
jgi:hypothetical protein